MWPFILGWSALNGDRFKFSVCERRTINEHLIPDSNDRCREFFLTKTFLVWLNGNALNVKLYIRIQLNVLIKTNSYRFMHEIDL